MVAFDMKFEIGRDAERTCDLKTGAAVGNIAHGAADASGAVESNGRRLEDSVSWIPSLFDHGSPPAFSEYPGPADHFRPGRCGAVSAEAIADNLRKDSRDLMGRVNAR
jgi:hypothetical protein